MIFFLLQEPKEDIRIKVDNQTTPDPPDFSCMGTKPPKHFSKYSHIRVLNHMRENKKIILDDQYVL